MVNRLIALIARQGGGKLLDAAVTRLVPATPKIGGVVATAALSRVARRSVPATIVIAGGILAKTLYDRRKSRLAQASDPVAEDEAGAPDADESSDKRDNDKA